jgi:putative transposase
LKFIKKALKRHGRPEAIVTDGLRSYGAALKDLGAQSLQAPVGRWTTTGPRTATSPFDDASGRWPASAG